MSTKGGPSTQRKSFNEFSPASQAVNLRANTAPYPAHASDARTAGLAATAALSTLATAAASPETLRWAIETSNRNPGHYRIDIAAVGKPPYVIRPSHALPEIKGPVSITGLAWAREGQYIAIDGSAYIKDQGVRTCPGALPGSGSASPVRATSSTAT